MKKTIRKSDVIREGYVAGLKEAKRIINEMMVQSTGFENDYDEFGSRSGNAFARRKPMPMLIKRWLELFKSGDLDIAEADDFLSRGVDVNARGESGETALMVLLLLDGDFTLEEEAYEEDAKRLPIVKWLISQGADVNVALTNGFTPIMSAAGRGLVEIAKVLMEAGANSEIKDDLGMNAQDYAEEYCPGKFFDEIVTILEGEQAVVWL